ncbi:hypothetical protein [Desulfosarcina ovata]|uniref:Uncharacterized protein n=2 Tax=Desulfosarcina ovata TaxID=83564 RepID=A0A5K8AMI2_9BACT|nr:hypothetical protein [Desulfosarcina ovata]BBO86116.1 hypothetical protein DSCO28_66820 [Desulfosarcina ovata subsp. sediminis]BBO93050.1 hypothetical protein DSCOOX_62300 [Desulfosarcina ovata subsp. ovata]
MYSIGGGLGISARKRKTAQDKGWQPNKNNERQQFKTGKAFVSCVCPKCASHHNVFMMWTGRGTPRKYCPNCRPLVAGYDDAAIYEACIAAPGHSKKKGRRLESE